MAHGAGDLTVEAGRPEVGAETSLASRFEEQVKMRAGEVAVVDRGRTLSYGELDAWANRLAQALLAVREDAGEPVPILLENRVAGIAAMLAAFKAGKVAVPLDAGLPAERLRALLEETGEGIVLSGEASLPVARELAAALGCAVLDAFDGAGPADPPRLRVPPDAPARIVFTSGSTGRPKGVVQSHRGLLWGSLGAARRDRIVPADRLLLVAASGSGQASAPLHALLNGASVLPADVEKDGLAGLRDWIARQGITVYHSVPSVFGSLVRALRPGETLPSLRLVKLGGDTVRREHVELFRRHFPEPCVLRIGYSSSETGNVTWHQLTAKSGLDGDIVPVGRPAAGFEVELAGEDGERVGPGESGEIVVRSRYLALGYWRRPDLTAERFGTDPGRNGERTFRTGDVGRFRPDGLLEHLGRTDFQVKIRGYRVEIGDVEAALGALPGVAEAVVAAPAGPDGAKRLAGYVVWSASPRPWRDVRAELARRLPDYMVPADLVSIPRVPLTSRGKVDRLALPPPSRHDVTGPPAEPAEPANELEERIAEVWKLFLRRTPVGTEEDFFESGGDSLLAADMFIELESRLGRSVPLSLFAESPTISGLARALRDAPTRWACLVPLETGGAGMPFFCVHTAGGEVLSYRGLARLLSPKRPFYGLRRDRLEDGQRPRFTRVEDMAEQYLVEIRTVQPHGPYLLGGLSLGSAIAFEMARRLKEDGEVVGALVLLEPTLPGGQSGKRAAAAIPGRRLSRAVHAALGSARFHGTILSMYHGRRRREYVREKIRNLLRKTGAHSADPWEEELRQLDRGLDPALRHVVEPFLPKPYDGRATLILSRNQPFGTDRRREWEPFVKGGLDVHVVPGAHEWILKEPFVRRLAPLLGRLLEDRSPTRA